MSKTNGNKKAGAKTAAPQITTADEYLKLVEQEEEAPRTFAVAMPSGATFLLRIPDVTGYAMTGRMPQKLTTEFLQSAEARGLRKLSEIKASVNELAEDLDLADANDSLIFVRELVREAVVQPRFGDGPGMVPYNKFKTVDFKFVFSWVLQHSGVAGLSGLQTFRPRRERRALKSRANRKKLRGSAVGAARN
jgi:hypothetical protein